MDLGLLGRSGREMEMGLGKEGEGGRGLGVVVLLALVTVVVQVVLAVDNEMGVCRLMFSLRGPYG